MHPSSSPSAPPSRPDPCDPYVHGERIEQVVAHHARLRPADIAVQQGHDLLTYGELARRADSVAAALRERGVSAGGRVAVRMARSPSWWSPCWGAARRCSLRRHRSGVAPRPCAGHGAGNGNGAVHHGRARSRRGQGDSRGAPRHPAHG
ncbi:AMP-binding protein [Streptomyces stramineus]